MADIILAGFGGQGILTAGKILINVAAEHGKNICWTSSYGAEMRGGTASCSIVISDEEIGSPYPSKLDILFAMNEPSYHKFIGQVRDGGYVIVNSSLMAKDIEYPKNVKVFTVDATDIANEVGNTRGANLVMLGTMMKATKLLDPKSFGEGLNAYFEKKKRNTPSNLQCYNLGIEKSVEK
ncbi:MAG: 2-oxoacid:acceptor oxidoreductase family protein [Acidaminococcus sp.]|jgi:2-oxoglutarate ferredoxin oxidoreductase subunit gamma|nr:2-oxoacid:acceptor oxidoreductase family protein [Acidaminococcus sp.]MCI2100848.1 2-oxoacid:acceptor oxidoreductase family protein [Acidaminococcus sp.]MCI2115211.1 2-oxoacid:acceptor oxidoreductase family protein [Acidaminococcus sp.]MCI2116656.1 2-oxoacid:acceptor oxidoreductase family protein [Acidaminococcus sp.]